MDLSTLRGYINGEVTCEDRRQLDSVYGSSDEAWQLAMEYGRTLRNVLKIKNLVVSVESKNSRLHYLYVEASTS